MPSEDTPVYLRSSIEACQWRHIEIQKALNNPIRPMNSVMHAPCMRAPLFTEKELKSLPYRQQDLPFTKSSSKWPSSNGFSTCNAPFVKTSREIERGLFRQEIQLLEKENQDIKQRAYHNQRLLLKINKALAVNMERL